MIVSSPHCSASTDTELLSRVDAWSILMEEPLNGSYLIGLNMPFAGVITSVVVKSQSGSGTGSVTIDNVVVTGLSAMTLDSTERTHAPSALNSFSTGQDVRFIISNNTSMVNLAVTIAFRRDP